MKPMYLAADRELADALGWVNIIQSDGPFPWMSGDNPKTGKFELIPSWCSESAATFELQLDHQVNIQLCKLDEDDLSACGVTDYVRVSILDKHGDEQVCIDADWTNEHESKEFAARYAIVKAVIVKITKKPTME